MSCGLWPRARRTAAACRARCRASAMPWLASTCMSYLRFCPTCVARSSSQGRSARARVRGRAAPARRDSGARPADRPLAGSPRSESRRARAVIGSRLVVSVSTRDQLARARRAQPARRAARVEHRFVFDARARCVAAASIAGGSACLAAIRRPDRRAACELRAASLELEALEQLAQARLVRRGGARSLRARPAARTSLLIVSSSRAQRQPVARLRRFSPTTPPISSALRDDAVERAVLGEPLGRGLRPDLVDARDVVDRCRRSARVVDDLVGARRTSPPRRPRRASRWTWC